MTHLAHRFDASPEGFLIFCDKLRLKCTFGRLKLLTFFFKVYFAFKRLNIQIIKSVINFFFSQLRLRVLANINFIFIWVVWNVFFALTEIVLVITVLVGNRRAKLSILGLLDSPNTFIYLSTPLVDFWLEVIAFFEHILLKLLFHPFDIGGPLNSVVDQMVLGFRWRVTLCSLLGDQPWSERCLTHFLFILLLFIVFYQFLLFLFVEIGLVMESAADFVEIRRCSLSRQGKSLFRIYRDNFLR